MLPFASWVGAVTSEWLPHAMAHMEYRMSVIVNGPVPGMLSPICAPRGHVSQMTAPT